MRHPTLEETIAFVKGAHAGQEYKPGVPYHVHLLGALTLLLRRHPAVSDDEKHAILLHDTLEDTRVTRGYLRSLGYTEATLDMVELVTNRQGETASYLEKIHKIIASGNLGALYVKDADMSYNSDPANMTDLPAERVAHYRRKYAEPLRMLKAAIAEAEARQR